MNKMKVITTTEARDYLAKITEGVESMLAYLDELDAAGITLMREDDWCPVQEKVDNVYSLDVYRGVH